MSEIGCPNIRGPQKAAFIVSAMTAHNSFLVATCGIALDVRESGIDADDSLNNPPDLPGLWVWEGTIKSSGGDDPDLWYTGAFRRPTVDELPVLVEGRNPWPCGECDGSGYVTAEKGGQK